MGNTPGELLSLLGLFNSTRLPTQRARTPVQVSQAVEDGAMDAVFSVGLEARHDGRDRTVEWPIRPRMPAWISFSSST